MEFIKKQFEQIKEHLGTLTASQSLVIFLLIVMIVVAMFWTIYQTAQPSMVALLDQTLTDSEIATYENKLEMWDATYKVESGKIMVKRQERDRLIARLGQTNALPTDMTESWRKLVLESDMWLSQEDRQNRWKLALEQRLSQIIQLMDGVQRAYVIINPGSKRLLSDGPSSDPSASVSIQTQSGAVPNKSMVLAVASMVSGAVDRLSQDRVRIIANGVPCRVPSDDSPFSIDALDTRRAYEKHFSEKVLQVLAIANAQVGVFVELETEAIQTTEKKYDDPVVSREHAIENNSEQNTPGGQPGVQPNIGATVAVTQSPGETTSQTETETEYNGDRSLTQTIKRNMLGSVKNIRATVNIPYSYFVGIYKIQTGSDEKPSTAELESIIKDQEANIRKKVLPIINSTDPTYVEVSHFWDIAPATVETTLAASGPTSMGDLTQYIKPAGLSLLAFVSLIMVLMMLMRSSHTVSIQNLEKAIKDQVESTPSLDNEGAPIGEASGSEGILEGIEVDDHTLRTRKMAEQVATMVKEDPGSAATLVRQWIIQSK